MITFGYKSKFSTVLRACAAVALGFVMLFSTGATETVVKIIAALLFSAGVISLIYAYTHKQEGYFNFLIANAVVDAVLGLVLFAFPSQVAHLIPYLIGIALLLFGILQMVMFSGTISVLGGPFFGMIFSAIAIFGGIALLFSPFSIRVMGIIAGVALIFYGVSEILSLWRLDKAKEAYEIKMEKKSTSESPQKPFSAESLSDAKEVEYEKVDEQ